MVFNFIDYAFRSTYYYQVVSKSPHFQASLACNLAVSSPVIAFLVMENGGGPPFFLEWRMGESRMEGGPPSCLGYLSFHVITGIH